MFWLVISEWWWFFVDCCCWVCVCFGLDFGVLGLWFWLFLSSGVVLLFDWFILGVIVSLIVVWDRRCWDFFWLIGWGRVFDFDVFWVWSLLFDWLSVVFGLLEVFVFWWGFVWCCVDWFCRLYGGVWCGLSWWVFWGLGFCLVWGLGWCFWSCVLKDFWYVGLFCCDFDWVCLIWVWLFWVLRFFLGCVSFFWLLLCGLWFDCCVVLWFDLWLYECFWDGVWLVVLRFFVCVNGGFVWRVVWWCWWVVLLWVYWGWVGDSCGVEWLWFWWVVFWWYWDYW